MKPTNAIAALAMAASLVTAPVAAQDFYEGKQLNFLINFAPGGPSDIEGRVVANHLAKHIPGDPTVVVQNISGAGGVIGVNHLGEVSEPDGLTLGYYTVSFEVQILQDPSLRVDYNDLEVISGVQGVQVAYIRRDVPPGLDQPEDVLDADSFIVAGLSATSTKDLVSRMSLDLLGVDHRYVTGFQGNAAARQAVQQNEVQFFIESLPAYRSLVEPTMVESGDVLPLFYYEVWENGEPNPSPDVPELMTFYDFYKKVKGEEPSGQLWEAYRISNTLATNMLRVIVMPPNSPPETVEIMRQAVVDLQNDPEFQAEAKKVFGVAPTFIPGEIAQRDMRELLTQGEGIREFLKQYIAQAQQ